MRELYFFADHVFDLTLYLGIINAIRDSGNNYRFILIIDSSPSLIRYDVDFTLKYFDEVFKVGYCNYGGFKSLKRSFQFAQQLDSINFKKGSVLFLSTGRLAVSNVLLSRAKKNGLSTVWFTVRDYIDSEDIVFDYKLTCLYNFYHALFGRSFVDVHKRRNAKESPAYINFREIPYDFTFYLRPAQENNISLKEDEIYYPFYFPNRSIITSRETILLCGAIFNNREWIRKEQFLKLYNRLIELIRKKHEGAKMIYLPHPREKEERNSLDLKGFQAISGINSELLLALDGSISTVYSVWSTASLTATLFGVRGYWFYRLFDDSIMDKERKEHFNSRYRKVNPNMFIENIDLWLKGNNDYQLTNLLQPIMASTFKMLQRIGIV